MPDLLSLPTVANVAIFAVSAIAVWFAGARMASCADAISRRFGVGEAVLGVLMLAVVTSMPEIATSLTAAARDLPKLAVNNLLGSIAMQVAVIALADFTIRERALTGVLPNAVVILQGGLNVMLLAFVALGVLLEDRPVFGAGLWSWGLLAAAAFSFWKITDAERGPQPWIRGEDHVSLQPGNDASGGLASREHPAGRLAIQAVAAALVILVAGAAVAISGEALARQSGLGSSFMGMVFVAAATSLPEVSTALAAVRLGKHTMAISDILGTNLLNVGLVFAVDAVAAGPPVLNRVGLFAAVGALLGIVVTTLYLVGLSERRDRTIGRLGVDSVLVLAVYAGGLVVLYGLRDAS